MEAVEAVDAVDAVVLEVPNLSKRFLFFSSSSALQVLLRGADK